jgi:hypothetical protein
VERANKGSLFLRILNAVQIKGKYPETAVMYMAGMMSIRFFPIRVMRKDLTFGVVLGQMGIYGR